MKNMLKKYLRFSTFSMAVLCISMNLNAMEAALQRDSCNEDIAQLDRDYDAMVKAFEGLRKATQCNEGDLQNVGSSLDKMADKSREIPERSLRMHWQRQDASNWNLRRIKDGMHRETTSEAERLKTQEQLLVYEREIALRDKVMRDKRILWSLLEYKINTLHAYVTCKCTEKKSQQVYDRIFEIYAKCNEKIGESIKQLLRYCNEGCNGKMQDIDRLQKELNSAGSSDAEKLIIHQRLMAHERDLESLHGAIRLIYERGNIQNIQVTLISLIPSIDDEIAGELAGDISFKGFANLLARLESQKLNAEEVRDLGDKLQHIARRILQAEDETIRLLSQQKAIKERYIKTIQDYLSQAGCTEAIKALIEQRLSAQKSEIEHANSALELSIAAWNGAIEKILNSLPDFARIVSNFNTTPAKCL